MSGFVGAGVYELTATKAEHWHRYCRCGKRFAREIVATHVVGAGFEARAGRGGRFWKITGPGLESGSTDALYAAVSGGARFERQAAAEHQRQVARINAGETFRGTPRPYRRRTARD